MKKAVFYKVAKQAGYNPSKYELEESLEALSIALQLLDVSFTAIKGSGEVIAAKGGKLITVNYSSNSEVASATVFRRDRWNSEFDQLTYAMWYLYWNFSQSGFETSVFEAPH